MEEKDVKEIYDNLTEENKEVLNLLAKGMQIAEKTGKEK